MKRIKVKYKKLGKNHAWGLAPVGANHIIIDERATGKKKIEVLSHEILHQLFPKLSEKEITEKAIILTNTLWHEGLRMTDNQNNIPLQDGKIHK